MNARTRILRSAVPSALAAAALALVGVLALNQTALAQEGDDSQAPTPGGLFHELDGNPPPSIGVDTLASRLVGIDFGQLSQVVDAPVSPKDPVTGKPTKPQTLALNLFDDVVFTGIVEHIEPTSSGHALWGGLEGVELGTMTLVVNGSVVVGTVRTPDAVYTIRTAGGGAYVVRQIDESSLLPLGEPLNGQSPAPDTRPPSPSQEQSPTEPVPPDGISTSTPTPVSTVPKAPSERAPEEAPAGGLFSEVEGVAPPSTGVTTVASRLVGIDFGQITQATNPQVDPKDPVAGKPTTLQALVLNLFDDVVFTGIVEDVEATSAGHALWGRLDGVGLGTFTLVVNGRVVIGTVRTPDAVYTIRTAGDGTYVIRQIDESSLPPLGEPLGGPLSTPEARSESDDVPPDDGSVIDVMVVYTTEAKHFEGGKAAIEALIDLFVAETNQANANSRVIHRIRLVLRDEVDYIEDGNSFIDLNRLTEDSDEYMDHVHELRDLYAADLVHIVVSRSVNVCGVAESIGGDESVGFALTVSECGGLTFAHELGHNMGLNHDRYVIRPGATGSNFGYVNQRMFDEGAPESARWRTIMAYYDQCEEVGGFYCPQVAYFSNPEVTHNDDPTGVPVDHPSTGVDGPAHAAATLNDRREITANFRRSSASPTPRVHLTLSPYWMSEDGGISTVTASLHRPSSAATAVTVSASPSGAVTLSGNRTLTIPAGQMVSSGSVTITGVDNSDQTGDVSVEVSATAENPSSLGVVEPEPVALAVADDETTPVVTLSLSPAEIVEFEGRTFVTAALDNRSVAETIVTISATPAEVVEEIEENTLTIPAGQSSSVGRGVEINAVDDSELTEAEKLVTVSGTAANSQGVTGPESVTLTINDDEAPFFADDSIAYTFTEGLAGSRFLPEAAYGKGPLTYSLSPTPSNGVTFVPGPPARIGTSSTSIASGETSYTLTVTDADGVKDSMTISITVRKGVCLNSAAVSGYTDPGIVHDCEALLVSRDVLGGDKSLDWSEDLSIGEWQGVSIVDGRVWRLQIAEEGLTGTIPSELGNLSNLQMLWLGGNQLRGGIPPEFGGLSKLEWLSLGGNQFTGGIPKELGSLSNLQSLWLGENQLTGEIPKELGNLSNLEWLALYRNGLTGTIPSELSKLSKLQRMLLFENRLTGEIPTELGSLSQLKALSLASNQLTGGIPTKLGGLSNLEWLELHDNQLTGLIPTELGNLSNLEGLFLADNRLIGCIPDGLRDVPRNDLVRLGLPFCSEHACVIGRAVPDAADNLGQVSDCGTLLAVRDVLTGTATLNWSADTPMADWSGVVLDGTSGRVTQLQLGNLGLNGEIPPDLGSLTELQHLDLSDNQLTGGIPAELGDLANLQELYLGGNSLTGCVPDGLRDVPNNDFTSLGLLFCSEHPCVSGGAVADTTNLGLMSDCVTLLEARDTLAGTGSLSWAADTPITQWDGVDVDGTPQRVTVISLNESGLTGELPKELGNLSNLEQLHLIDNQLTGEIPPELGNLSNLRWLLLWENQLKGEIPTELGDLSNLRELSLSSNKLTGEIPADLGNLSNLTGLYLSSNQLTGEIPVEVGSLSNLQELNLDGNLLKSGIPMELGNLFNLHSLDLSDNQLAGEIPVDLGSLDNLQELRLNENQLMGEIPTELGNLSDLQWLSLYDNQLTGEIPTELGNLSDLQWLSLYDNQLTGEIPTELGSLSDLRGLDLPSNQLTGAIPTELGNLSNLEVLSLWGNQLTGEIPTGLGNLDNLEVLYLSGNRLTGCIPHGLRDVPNNDLDQLGLSYCSVSSPEAPVIGTVTRGMDLLVISWSAPSSDGGSAITAYDLRYIETAANETVDSNWTVVEDVWTTGGGTLEYTLTELTADTEYDLQLRAVNAAGEGPWSVTTTATPTTASACVAGGAVSDATNTGLATDCEALLAARDVLAVSATLNWSADTAISDWDGVTLRGTTARVRYLDLRDRGLGGSIPADLDRLSNLTYLNLRRNDLTGPIPTELDSLTSLRVLNLHSNELSGTIPDLSSMTHLQQLYLANNSLSGGLPEWLGDMTNVKELWLWGNELSGPIPDLSGMTALDRLKLQDNQLTGDVPAWFGEMTNLRYLYLHRNPLGGTIPPELGGMTKLRYVWLHSNELTGEIPEDLGNLDNLWDLNLHTNALEGSIPTELGDLSSLTHLRLHRNELSGPIPGELGNLSSLKFMWLHGNQLTGEIPVELGNLAKLQRLYLSENRLTGDIPAELDNLADTLTHWRLAGNQFTGCVPAGLAAIADTDLDSLGLQVCSDS